MSNRLGGQLALSTTIDLFTILGVKPHYCYLVTSRLTLKRREVHPNSSMEESEGRSHVQVDQQDDEEFVHTVNLTDNEQQEQEKNAEMSPDVDINANLDKLFPSHFSN